MKKPNKQAQPPKEAKQLQKAPSHPWKPVVVSTEDRLRLVPGVLHPSDVVALLAVSEGIANEEQQKRAFQAIVYKISCVKDQPYRPDAHGGDRDTAFACGKKYVGLEIVKLVTHSSLYLKD